MRKLQDQDPGPRAAGGSPGIPESREYSRLNQARAAVVDGHHPVCGAHAARAVVVEANRVRAGRRIARPARVFDVSVIAANRVKVLFAAAGGRTEIAEEDLRSGWFDDVQIH